MTPEEIGVMVRGVYSYYHSYKQIEELKRLSGVYGDIRRWDIIPGNEESMLHIAVTHGHIDVITWLLSYGFDMNVADDIGMTPAHYAAERPERADVFEVLINFGCDMTKKDCDNYTPDQLARSAGTTCDALTKYRAAKKARVKKRKQEDGHARGSKGGDTHVKHIMNLLPMWQEGTIVEEEVAPGDGEEEGPDRETTADRDDTGAVEVDYAAPAADTTPTADTAPVAAAPVAAPVATPITEEEEPDHETVADRDDTGIVEVNYAAPAADTTPTADTAPVAAAPVAAPIATPITEEEEPDHETMADRDDTGTVEVNYAFLVRDAAASGADADSEMLGSVEQLKATRVDDSWSYQGTAKSGGVIVTGLAAWFNRHFFKYQTGKNLKKTLHQNEGKNITVPGGSASSVSSGYCETTGNKGEAGFDSGNGGMTVAPPGGNKVPFKQGMSSTCGRCALLNGLNKLGFDWLAKLIKQTKGVDLTGLSMVEAVQLVRDKYKFEFVKEGKLYPTPETARADPQRFLLKQLHLKNPDLYKTKPILVTLSNAGCKIYHVVMFYDGNIYDSNMDFAIPVTVENLDFCAHGTCTNVAHAQQIIAPKKSKKREHESNQSTTKNKRARA